MRLHVVSELIHDTRYELVDVKDPLKPIIGRGNETGAHRSHANGLCCRSAMFVHLVTVYTRWARVAWGGAGRGRGTGALRVIALGRGRGWRGVARSGGAR